MRYIALFENEEMVKKAVVVIASVLKPVDDTRMYEKMAQSLARTGKFWVNILGFFSNTHSEHRDIVFHPIFQFPRNHYRRILANSIFLKALKQLKPDLIILTTPELAPATLWYRFLPDSESVNVKIVYDMIENHQLNLQHHHQRYPTLRKPLINIITYWEKQLVRKSQIIFVAEQGYFREKPWLRSFPSVLLENKVLPGITTHSKLFPKKDDLSLVYTGTISTAYGIWDALRFVEQLYHALDGQFVFRLVGHVPQQDTYRALREYTEKRTWVQATISEQPLPHHLLLEAMKKAAAGIVSHQPLPSLRNCFPTRIWEYMACGLPFFLQNHAPWVAYCQPWDCAIPIDFSQPDWPMASIIRILNERKFYTEGIPEEIYWHEDSFLSAIDEVITHDQPETIR